VIRYTHDANARVTSITHPSGLVTTNIHYTSGPYTGFLKTRIEYDKATGTGIRTNHYTWINGNLDWHTNELGLVTRRIWDNLNRLTSVSYPDSTTVSNVYNKLDLAATKDRLGQWTSFGYDRLRQMTARTNVNGRVTEWDWCNCGSPTEITEWNGSTPVITQFAYDMAGRMTNVIYPDNYSRSYQYDSASRVSRVIDSAGVELQLYYDAYGLVQYATLEIEGSSQGNLFLRTYDQYGRLASEYNRDNVGTTFEYDLLGRMTNRTVVNWPDPSVESFSWTALGLRKIELVRANQGTRGANEFNADSASRFTNASQRSKAPPTSD
jgi:YD repeat-containing protein